MRAAAAAGARHERPPPPTDCSKGQKLDSGEVSALMFVLSRVLGYRKHPVRRAGQGAGWGGSGGVGGWGWPTPTPCDACLLTQRIHTHLQLVPPDEEVLLTAR